MATSTPVELLKLAAWYRSFAELAGNADERQRRLAQADYLDRLACEHEGAQPGGPERRLTGT